MGQDQTLVLQHHHLHRLEGRTTNCPLLVQFSALNVKSQSKTNWPSQLLSLPEARSLF